ncbi:glycosyltransferase family A protein [Patescibacteria group bacterium]
MKLSVIIPTYNQVILLKKTLESLRQQSYEDFEIIVVDDGSTDDTGTFIKSQEGIIYLKQNNSGPPVARNSGAKIAQGDYLLFCDSDVIIYKNMLSVMVSELNNNPDINFVYGGFKYGRKTFSALPFNIDRLKKMNYISTMSMLRKKYFPGFDEKLLRYQDWDLWLTMVEDGSIGKPINDILFMVHRHKNEISNWLPSFIASRKLFNFLKPRKQLAAEKIIKNKHHLN